MRVMNRYVGAGIALGLSCLVATAATAVDSQEERFETLNKEYGKAQREVYKAQQKATTAAELAAASPRKLWASYRERFNDLAAEGEGTEVAASAWSVIFSGEYQNGDAERGQEAFQVLAFDHSSSLALEGVIAAIPSYDREGKVAIDGLHSIVETSERDVLRAGALFSLGKILEGSEETREEAYGYYRRVVAEFGALKGPRGSSFGDLAKASLFEVEYLQVGMAVPDFSSTDETNAPFKLSDYKGKVTLVDFWGFW